MKHFLSHMTWVEAKEAADADRVVIVPIGSMEGNGPRNVIGYDYFVSEALAREAAERTGSVWIPTLPYGIPDGLDKFPGTIAMNGELITEMVEAVLRSLLRSGFRHILLITNHGPNQIPTEVAARRVGKEARIMFASINPAVIATDLRKDLFEPSEIGHGSEPGMSLMMHLVPGMVREEVGPLNRKRNWQSVEIVGPYEGKIGPTRANMNFIFEELSPTSSWGDHSKASAERGEELFGRMVNFVSAFVEQYRQMDMRLDPPAPVSTPKSANPGSAQ